MAVEQPGPRKVIYINRTTFVLSLYRRPDEQIEVERHGWIRTRSYKIAVGAQGHETPEGFYEIYRIDVDPVWTKPKSPWVPEEEWLEKVPAGDPENPLIGRFLALRNDGIGIHGTRATYSLGSAASHGCIRMDPDDVRDLAKRIDLGTLVHIT